MITRLTVKAIIAIPTPIKDCEQFGLCWRKIRVADTKSNFEMIFVDNTPMRKP